MFLAVHCRMPRIHGPNCVFLASTAKPEPIGASAIVDLRKAAVALMRQCGPGHVVLGVVKQGWAGRRRTGLPSS